VEQKTPPFGDLFFLWLIISVQDTHSSYREKLIMETIVQCNNCMWQGEEEELASAVDLNDGTFLLLKEYPHKTLQDEHEPINACPNCKTDEYLMDIGGDL